MESVIISANQEVIPYSQKSSTAKENWGKAAFKVGALVKNMGLIKKLGFTGLILRENYWQEKLLSQRPGKDEIAEHLDSWIKSKTPFSFERWLMTEKQVELNTTVKYFSKQERSEYQIFFKKGRLYTNNGQLLDKKYCQKTNRTRFVIGPDKNFYVFDKKKKCQKDRHQHSSLFSGEAIIGAGILEMSSEGKIIYISNDSGHYKPGPQQMLETLQLLQEDGIDLKGVSLDLGSSKFYTCAAQYLATKGQCEPRTKVKSKL